MNKDYLDKFEKEKTIYERKKAALEEELRGLEEPALPDLKKWRVNDRPNRAKVKCSVWAHGKGRQETRLSLIGHDNSTVLKEYALLDKDEALELADFIYQHFKDKDETKE